MASLQVNFWSDALRMRSSMRVILPQPSRDRAYGGQAGKPMPVLYLLHGLSDDEGGWMRETAIERYVNHHYLAVVMPNGHRSFYVNGQVGQYFTYLSEELPAICKQFFNISDKREDAFVAGLSMGGYGALLLGLTHPERYAAVAALSPGIVSARAINSMPKAGTEFWEELRRIFGDSVRPEHDLLLLADDAAKKEKKPRIFVCSGTEDSLYSDITMFRDHLRTLPLPFHYEEHEGYAHTWDYWDKQIQAVLKWLYENKEADS